MHEHLTRELFRAISGGWRNPGDLAAIAFAHLFELCHDCRREFESWRRELEDASSAPEGADYEAVIEGIQARVEEPLGGSEAPIQSEIREARSRAEELLRLAPEQQAEWIRTESGRFAGLLLAEVLIEEGWRRTPAYPHDGYALASLARLVLHHLPASLRTTALYARALAHMANAVRVIGDLPRSEQILGDARYLLLSQGGGDRLLRAEVDRLEGSLRLDQRRPRDAIRVLLHAQMVYGLEGLQREAVATLVLLSKAHRRLGELDRSFEILDQADKGLRRTPLPRLLIIAGQRRAALLLRSGRPEGALEALSELEDLTASHGDPVIDLRRAWTRGLISRDLGELDAAEQALLPVIEGLGARRMISDLALVRLELGGIYAAQARLAEAGELADQAASTFADIGLPGKEAEARKLGSYAANR
jgi:tetratricopeptide (TPR) repeat protein